MSTTTTTTEILTDIEAMLDPDYEAVTAIEPADSGSAVPGYILSAQLQVVDQDGHSIAFVPERCEGYVANGEIRITATWSRQIGTGEWPQIATEILTADEAADPATVAAAIERLRTEVAEWRTAMVAQTQRRLDNQAQIILAAMPADGDLSDRLDEALDATGVQRGSESDPGWVVEGAYIVGWDYAGAFPLSSDDFVEVRIEVA